MQTVVNMQLYYDMLVFMLYAVHTLSIIHYMLWVVGHLFLFVIARRSSYFNDIFLVLFTILCRINKTTTQHNRLRVLCAIILL